MRPSVVARAVRKSRAWARVRPSFTRVAVIWCISSSVLTAFAQTPTNNPSRTDNTDSLIAAAETELHPATNQTGSARSEPPRKPSIFDSIPRTKPPKPATNQTAFAGTNEYAYSRSVSVLPFEELKKKAESGDAVAQSHLAMRYWIGQGVSRDEAEGTKWMRKSAEQGYSSAAAILGRRCAHGVGCETNIEEAIKWFRIAAEHGDAETQWDVGSTFLSGWGNFPKDEAEGFKWCLKAAQRGLARAQLIVGACYYGGHGVPQDDKEAAKWFRKAAEQTVARDQSNLIPTGLAEQLLKYAEQDVARAQYNLGVCYDNGQGVPQDHAEAVKWFRKAAEQGEAMAQVKLGLCYHNGEGVTKDYQEAVKWYRKAAEQGYAYAQFSLGFCYHTGEGVTKDDKETVKWYRKAAEQGDASAQHNLGLCYHEGEGVTKDDKEAVKWYRKAAEQGGAMAQVKLGLCYHEGEGVPQDYIEAYKWYNLATAQGDKQAGKFRDFLSKQMTREQIAEAQRRASRFVARPEKGAGGGSTAQPEAADVPVGSGTGFLITVGNSPCVLTAHHVVKDATAIKVVVGGKAFTARVAGDDPANDLAVLRIAASASDILAVALSQPALPITASRQVKLGDAVFTIGFPNTAVQGVAPKLTRGEINSLAGIQDDPRYFQTSVAVQPGNSGGPLVDVRGNVIGVMTMRLDDLKTLELTGTLPQNVNYGLKSSFVLAFLESVPELSGALSPPHTENRKFEDVVKEVQQATVMVIVY
ncbi:MAG: trypsin-like peptidase domain-containing protein [Verrucomicrobiia bacterium]